MDHIAGVVCGRSWSGGKAVLIVEIPDGELPPSLTWGAVVSISVPEGEPKRSHGYLAAVPAVKPRIGERLDLYESRAEAEVVRRQASKRTKVCLDCNSRMTWGEAKGQHTRLVRRGLSAEHIKLAMPRCQKCMTVYLRFYHDDTRGKPGPKRRQQWRDGAGD